MAHATTEELDKTQFGRVLHKRPRNENPVVYLRCVDPGTDCECWIVCAKGDPEAVAFIREDSF